MRVIGRFPEIFFELGKPGVVYVAYRVIYNYKITISIRKREFSFACVLFEQRCPTLIVHGRQDPVPIASSEAAARAMGAELVALDACGHVPYVERRAELFAALRSFLHRTTAR